MGGHSTVSISDLKHIPRVPETMAPTDDITSRIDSVNDEDPTEKSNSELNKRLLAVEWNEDEEKHILKRLDFYLIPLVMVMFFTLNLDRYTSSYS